MPTLTDIGRIGRDAELRYTPSGDPVVNLALACEFGRKGQDGKRQVQWVDASIWGRQAEALAPYLLKGQQVYFTIDDAHVETFQKGDGGTGFKLTGRVIVIKFSGGATQQDRQPHPQEQAARQPAPRQAQQKPQAQTQAADCDGFDDDIPF